MHFAAHFFSKIQDGDVCKQPVFAVLDNFVPKKNWRKYQNLHNLLSISVIIFIISFFFCLIW